MRHSRNLVLLRAAAAAVVVAIAAGPSAAAGQESRANDNVWPDAYTRDKAKSRVRIDTTLGSSAPIPEAELVPALLKAIDELSKYPRSVSAPEIHRIPQDELARLVCGAPCPARAVYRPGEGIYLDVGLKPETSVFDRSVLLHELVHYVQEMGNEHGDMKPCLRWYHREQEAYAIQKTFLVVVGSPVRVAYSAHRDACDGEPVTQNARQP